MGNTFLKVLNFQFSLFTDDMILYRETLIHTQNWANKTRRPNIVQQSFRIQDRSTQKWIVFWHLAAATEQIGLHSFMCLAPLPLRPCLTNLKWLRLRISTGWNWRRQKCKRKYHCLQKKRLSREASRWIVMRNSAPMCTVRSATIAFLFYFFWLFNIVRCKEIGSSLLNNCAARFQIKYWQQRLQLPLRSACLAGREGKELACW